MNSYSTPSIGIRAVKPVSPIKIGWIAPISWDAAQVRIRVLNIDRVLRSWGYRSVVGVNYPDIINQNFDVAIVGKVFDEHHYRNIRMLKQYKKTVFTDICEEILEFPWVKEILCISDKVVCCSYALEEKIKVLNPRTVVIEDAYEQ
jgi:hypothetical protein